MMKNLISKKSQKMLLFSFFICVIIICILKISALTNPVLSFVGLNNFGEPNQTIIEKSVASLFILCAIIIGICYARCTFSQVEIFFHNAKSQIKDFLLDKKLFNKTNALVLLVIFLISFIGFISLLRGNIDFQDDIDRNHGGAYAWGYYSSRWVTEIANLLIHESFRVHDRSPLGQIIGIIVLSCVAFSLSYIFSSFAGENRIRKRNALASIIVVFNPYFLQCMSYKYDAVGMALSVLFSIIPFLFLGRKELFFISSFICVLLTYLSYQSSSGIYILMVLSTGVLQYLLKEKNFKELILYFVKSAFSYLFAVFVFYFVFRSMAPDINPLTDIAFGGNIIRNIIGYCQQILLDFNGLWIAFFVLLLMFSLLSVLILSKRKKLHTSIVFLLFVITGYIFSFGGYIFLANYNGLPRYVYSIGIFIAVLANISVCCNFRIFILPSLFIFWSFFTFSFSFGNALLVQQNKDLLYEKMVLSDLNELFPIEQYPSLRVIYDGNVDFSRELNRVIEDFPITAALIQRVNYGDNWVAGLREQNFDATISMIRKDAVQFSGTPELLCSRRYYDIYYQNDGGGYVIVKGK